MSKTRLVADIGGTNTRIGLAYDRQLDPKSVKSYQNDAFSSFDEVLAKYSKIQGDIEEIVIAVAGPISNGKARLTNREWFFHADLLSKQLDGARAHILNDLTALGYGSPSFPAASLSRLVPREIATTRHKQSLIIGIGTGFNVSPVIQNGNHVTCLVVEQGHVALPQDVTQLLKEKIREQGRNFETVEHLFSGRGYAAIQASIEPQEECDAFYATLIAQLTRNLVLSYLPLGGIYFAGGVARHVLKGRASEHFIKGFTKPFALDPTLSVPVHIIHDDAAALMGCAAFALD